MGRTKGSSGETKPTKSCSAVKDPPAVGSHGYTVEETEAAFFLCMEQQKEKEPGLKLSGAVELWKALATSVKNEYRHRARLLFQNHATTCEIQSSRVSGASSAAGVSSETGKEAGVELGEESCELFDELLEEGRSRKRSRTSIGDEDILDMGFPSNTNYPEGSGVRSSEGIVNESCSSNS